MTEWHDGGEPHEKSARPESAKPAEVKKLPETHEAEPVSLFEAAIRTAEQHHALSLGTLERAIQNAATLSTRVNDVENSLAQHAVLFTELARTRQLFGVRPEQAVEEWLPTTHDTFALARVFDQSRKVRFSAWPEHKKAKREEALSDVYVLAVPPRIPEENNFRPLAKAQALAQFVLAERSVSSVNWENRILVKETIETLKNFLMDKKYHPQSVLAAVQILASYGAELQATPLTPVDPKRQVQEPFLMEGLLRAIESALTAVDRVKVIYTYLDREGVFQPSILYEDSETAMILGTAYASYRLAQAQLGYKPIPHEEIASPILKKLNRVVEEQSDPNAPLTYDNILLKSYRCQEACLRGEDEIVANLCQNLTPPQLEMTMSHRLSNTPAMAIPHTLGLVDGLIRLGRYQFIETLAQISKSSMIRVMVLNKLARAYRDGPRFQDQEDSRLAIKHLPETERNRVLSDNPQRLLFAAESVASLRPSAYWNDTVQVQLARAFVDCQLTIPERLAKTLNRLATKAVELSHSESHWDRRSVRNNSAYIEALATEARIEGLSEEELAILKIQSELVFDGNRMPCLKNSICISEAYLQARHYVAAFDLLERSLIEINQPDHINHSFVFHQEMYCQFLSFVLDIAAIYQHRPTRIQDKGWQLLAQILRKEQDRARKLDRIARALAKKLLPERSYGTHPNLYRPVVHALYCRLYPRKRFWSNATQWPEDSRNNTQHNALRARLLNQEGNAEVATHYEIVARELLAADQQTVLTPTEKDSEVAARQHLIVIALANQDFVRAVILANDILQPADQCLAYGQIAVAMKQAEKVAEEVRSLPIAARPPTPSASNLPGPSADPALESGENKGLPE